LRLDQIPSVFLSEQNFMLNRGYWEQLLLSRRRTHHWFSMGSFGSRCRQVFPYDTLLPDLRHVQYLHARIQRILCCGHEWMSP